MSFDAEYRAAAENQAARHRQRIAAYNLISADSSVVEQLQEQNLRQKQALNEKTTALFHAAKDMEGWRTKAKQLGKQLGRAGQTIHNLRADVALLRSKDGSMIGAMYLQQRRENDELRKDNERLRRELFAAKDELRTTALGANRA